MARCECKKKSVAKKSKAKLEPERPLLDKDEEVPSRLRPKPQVKKEPGIEYLVDGIVNEGIHDSGVLLYRVMWTGYDASYNTWEPARNFARCTDVLRRWRQVKETLVNRGNAKFIDSASCDGDTIFDSSSKL